MWLAAQAALAALAALEKTTPTPREVGVASLR